MVTAFLYTDEYFQFQYGATHPLKMERIRLTYDLCKAYGLFDLPDVRFIKTRPASESEILRFHTPEYVDSLKRASKGRSVGLFSHGLGPGDNPIFPGLWEWSQLHTGASLQCAHLVDEGEAQVSFNIAGGLHHAMADRASGFCYVNDPVLTIFHFLDRGKRVMYLDIDAHHGDGVQWAFYEDPRVLTVSFHQDPRTLFPGTGSVQETGRGQGLGYAVNVPMLPGTDDGVFWKGFSEIVPRLLDQYEPDVVVSQLGVDGFWSDPLASLELTTNGFCKVVSYLREHASSWVALGGGGYNVNNVARAWTLAWAIMNGVELPEDLPEALAGVMWEKGRSKGRLRDPERKSPRYEQCAQQMDECIRYLEKNVFPIVRM
jgi:acetoin utilization protein AcuC